MLGKRKLLGIKEVIDWALTSVNEFIQIIIRGVFFERHIRKGRSRARRRPNFLPRSGRGPTFQELRRPDSDRHTRESKELDDWVPESLRLIRPIRLSQIDVTERRRTIGILVARVPTRLLLENASRNVAFVERRTSCRGETNKSRRTVWIGQHGHASTIRRSFSELQETRLLGKGSGSQFEERLDGDKIGYRVRSWALFAAPRLFGRTVLRRWAAKRSRKARCLDLHEMRGWNGRDGIKCFKITKTVTAPLRDDISIKILHLIKEMLAVAIVQAYMDIGIGREKAGAILPHGRRGETLEEIE
jgi:hypothetical protein